MTQLDTVVFAPTSALVKRGDYAIEDYLMALVAETDLSDPPL